MRVAEDTLEGYTRQRQTQTERESAYKTAAEWFTGVQDDPEWLPVEEGEIKLENLHQLSQRELLRAFLWVAMDTFQSRAERSHSHTRPSVGASREHEPDSSSTGTTANKSQSIKLSTAWTGYQKDQQRQPENSAWTEGRTPVSAQQAYEDMLELFGDKPMAMIDRDMCRQFRELQEKRPLKRFQKYQSWTAMEILQADIPIPHRRKGKAPQKIVGRMKRFFSWAVAEQYLTVNPALELPTAVITGSTTKIWQEEELCKLFSEASLAEDSGICDPRAGLQNLPLIMLLLLYTGARLNEVCYLRCEDFYRVDPHSDGEVPAIRIQEFQMEEGADKGGMLNKTVKTPAGIRAILT